MSYLIAIKTAIIIFPFIALLITIPFILLSYHKYGSINKIKTLVIYSFILYLITIYFQVLIQHLKYHHHILTLFPLILLEIS